MDFSVLKKIYTHKAAQAKSISERVHKYCNNKCCRAGSLDTWIGEAFIRYLFLQFSFTICLHELSIIKENILSVFMWGGHTYRKMFKDSDNRAVSNKV